MNNNDLLTFNFTCAETQALLAPAYNYMMTAECVLAWLAIPPNLVLILVIWHVTVFSSNLRLLMAHFSFILLWYSIGTIVTSVYIFSSTSSCDYPLSVRNCKIFELTTTGLALANVLYSFLALCAQRLHAALKYRNYDTQTQKKPWLALGLIGGSWAIALVVNCGQVFWSSSSISSSEQQMKICVSSFLPPSQSNVTFILYLIFEILATLTVIFVYFYTNHISKNMSINRAQFDLSSRFQVDQNVRINAMVVPSLFLHVLCHVPTFVLLSGFSDQLATSSASKPWLTRITYLMRLIYCLIHPILAFSLNSSMRNHLLELRIGSVLALVAGKCTSKSARNSNSIAGVEGNHSHHHSHHHHHSHSLHPPSTMGHGASTIGGGDGTPNNQAYHFNMLDKVWADQQKRASEQKRKSQARNGGMVRGLSTAAASDGVSVIGGLAAMSGSGGHSEKTTKSTRVSTVL